MSATQIKFQRIMAAIIFGMAMGIFFPTANRGMELSLPPESDQAPEVYDWFPNRLTAFVWRNWNLVPLDRMAKLLEGEPDRIREMAQRLGLPKEEAPTWSDSQFYITLIRRNWHLLPFSQLTELTNLTEQRFAFCLIEDDFLWIKLGSVKPKLEPLRWTEPSAAEWKRIDEIGQITREFLASENGQREKRFAFINKLKTTTDSPSRPDSEADADAKTINRFPLRYVHSYFALFGDPLLEDNGDLYPDGLLEKLAASGVNGVWLHVVLRDLAPGGPDFPEFGEGWETRQANLRKLVERAKRHGIDVYLYMNEPRAVQKSFFKNHPDFGGVTQGELQAICSSRPEIKKWLGDALANLFANVPGLGGIFTITASENLTTCASQGANHQKNCPRCAKRPNADIIAEINAVMEEGVHRSAPDAKVIVWDWGWNGHGLSPEIIKKLPENVRFMSVSEWGLPLNRGGIPTTVGEYSISAVGPGPRALTQWKTARDRELKTAAKVQLNVTWEISSVPFVPALELVARHVRNLAEEGVDSLMMSWSLGGYPSPNLDIPRLFCRDPLPSVDEVLDRLATDRYGDQGRESARRGWAALSRAYAEFPYGGSVLYCAPTQIGPANPLRIRPTGYRATMTGIPYDDLDAWRGPYPPEIFASQLEKIADGFTDGIAELRLAEKSTPEAKKKEVALEIRCAEAVRVIYRSVANQTRFVVSRNEWLAERTSPDRKAELVREMTRLADDEIDMARQLYRITGEDSRIGFESSNQYFFTANDLLEKIVNARFIRDHLAEGKSEKF